MSDIETVREFINGRHDWERETIAALDRIAEALAEAEKALEPFELEANTYDPDENDGEDFLWMSHNGGCLRIKHLRHSRAALTQIRSLTNAKG